MAQVLVAALFVIAGGCSGGGCSSGCSCGGISPLPEGFKPEQRIENSASMRITDSGMKFLSANLGTIAANLIGGGQGVMTFDIPKTSGSFDAIVAGVDYTVCPNGANKNANPPECVAEIDIADAKLNIDPTNPHDLHITGPLPVRVRKLRVHLKYAIGPCPFCVKFDSDVDITLTADKSCPGGANPYAPIQLDVDVPISIDPNQMHSRYGYSRVKVTANITSKLTDYLKVCGGLDAAVINALLPLVGGQIQKPLVSTLNSQLDKQLCQKANTMLNPPCPAGTQDVNGVCRYGATDSAECASIVLGTEGHIDLGKFLQGLSAGASGAFDFLLAAGGHDTRPASTEHWGDLNPVGKGMTLGMYGGTEPAPPSQCVPRVDSVLPTGIPIPDEIVSNTIMGWPTMLPGPHFGVALSERFANYAFWKVLNSGALFLGITGDAIGSTRIHTKLLALGLGANSLAELGRQREPAAMAFMLRPQKPPTITFGNGTDIEKDPVMDIKLPSLAIDFYVWSLDRYIRALTITTDIEVPANLVVTPDGLTPVIKTLKLSNTTGSNAELLREDPKVIAAKLEGFVGPLIGGALGGAFKPININSQISKYGIQLEIPDTVDGQGSPGLRKLTKDSDNFLGIFASLGVAMPMPPPPEMTSLTRADVLRFDVDPAGLRYDTMTERNGPRARIRLGSSMDDGTRAVEWQYRVDTQPWHPFSRARDLDLDDPVLRNQGVHKVYVRSRVVGDVWSLGEAKVVELRVDDMAPVIKITKESTKEGKRIKVDASDLVSGDRVLVRVRLGVTGSAWDSSSRLDDNGVKWGEWSTWQPANELAAFSYEHATVVQVEAKDEGENIGTVTEPLIRGQEDTTGAGCQCNTPGSAAPSGWLGLLGLGSLAAALGFRRTRARARARNHPRARGSLARHVAAGLALLLVGGAAPGCHCSAADQNAGPNDCRHRGDCQVIAPGLVGAYTSAAANAGGGIWVAGYLEANWDPNVQQSWGDLVVGAVNPTSGMVDWRVIDGTSPDEIVDPQKYDAKGFRDGKNEPGDDVGLWTSVALDTDGNPGVAYYDATHHALKYAHLGADGAWTVSTVKPGSGNNDYGLYAKLAFVGGAPNIAFHYAEPTDMAFTTGVRLAVGIDAAGSQWSFEEVAADPATACNAKSCPSGQACLTNGKCVATSGACMSCGSGKQCVDDGMGGGTCSKVRNGGAPGTYPNENGIYIALGQAQDGSLRVAYYDRPHGNVMLATKMGGAWSSKLIDGADGMGKDTGDKGIGLSLAVDAAGNSHMAYVDGLSEGVDYVMVAPDGTVSPPELVDDGLAAMEGHHLVGDDSNVLVTQSGEVRVSYQDATTGKLVVAVGTPSGNGHTWKLNPQKQDNFGGFFSKQLLVGGQYRVLNWWRAGNPLPIGDVRVLSPQ